jgi:para-aminobenzoate synthetase/4-amino-4-deoxychorismate lyase
MQADPAFELIETMRLEHGRFVRRERHLHRLSTSARYFDFKLDRVAIGRALDAHAAEYPSDIRRARLLLARSGMLRVESVPFTQPTGLALPRVAIADSPVASHDRFLFHKTTNRSVYDRHRQRHPEVFDVLLWNEREELTEFTIGNVVLEIDGVRWTPARECGLLNGVYREELLALGTVRERVLPRRELERATRVWLINSLREWVEIEVVGGPERRATNL